MTKAKGEESEEQREARLIKARKQATKAREEKMVEKYKDKVLAKEAKKQVKEESEDDDEDDEAPKKPLKPVKPIKEEVKEEVVEVSPYEFWKSFIGEEEEVSDETIVEETEEVIERTPTSYDYWKAVITEQGDITKL